MIFTLSPSCYASANVVQDRKAVPPKWSSLEFFFNIAATPQSHPLAEIGETERMQVCSRDGLHCSSRILQQLQSTSSILTTAILQVCDTTQDLQGSSSILVQCCQSAILQDLQSTSPIQVQQVSSCLPEIGEAQRVLVCFPDGLYCSSVILQDLQSAILPKWACLLEIGEAQHVPVGSRGAAVRVHSSKSLF